MKKWLIAILIIALAALPFAAVFAHEEAEQEEWFLIRMETNRTYIQKLLDAELISEEEAAERLAYLDERIAYMMENGFEYSDDGYHHGSGFRRGYSWHGRGLGGYGGGFCH